MAVRRSVSHSSVCWPTSLTHQASASERERATPASTRVSSTWRSGWRSRVITGADEVGEQLLGVAAAQAPGDLALVAVLDLPGDPDPVVSGVLPELVDPAGLRGGLVGVGGLGGQLGLRQAAPDDDLVAVDRRPAAAR